MIRFEIKKETSVRMGQTAFVKVTTAELEKHFWQRGDTFEKLVASFEDNAEARVCFEAEKANCETYRQGTDIVYDRLSLEQVEVDEDGDFIESFGGDSYIAELTEDDE